MRQGERPRPAHRPQTAQNNDAKQTTGDIPGTDTPEPRWAARWAGKAGGLAGLDERMPGVPGGFVALKWLGWGGISGFLCPVSVDYGTGELGSRIQVDEYSKKSAHDIDYAPLSIRIKEIGWLLGDRIRREESELYPLYHDLY